MSSSFAAFLLWSACLASSFPSFAWPSLDGISLTGLLPLPRLTLPELVLRLPEVAWPSPLAQLVLLLRFSLPDLAWPALPALSLPDWEQSALGGSFSLTPLPAIELSAVQAALSTLFPDVAWPALPAVALADLAPLPALSLPEVALELPEVTAWPLPAGSFDLRMLVLLLRLGWPDLAWPTPLPALSRNE